MGFYFHVKVGCKSTLTLLPHRVSWTPHFYAGVAFLLYIQMYFKIEYNSINI